MAEPSEIWRREELKRGMRQVFDQTLEERVERYLEVAHQGVNPSVSRVPFCELARRNLLDLPTIEREIFAVSFDNGKLVPVQPRYWDLQPDGTTSVFLRNPWVGA